MGLSKLAARMMRGKADPRDPRRSPTDCRRALLHLESPPMYAFSKDHCRSRRRTGRTSQRCKHLRIFTIPSVTSQRRECRYFVGIVRGIDLVLLNLRTLCEGFAVGA